MEPQKWRFRRCYIPFHLALFLGSMFIFQGYNASAIIKAYATMNSWYRFLLAPVGGRSQKCQRRDVSAGNIAVHVLQMLLCPYLNKIMSYSLGEVLNDQHGTTSSSTGNNNKNGFHSLVLLRHNALCFLSASWTFSCLSQLLWPSLLNFPQGVDSFTSYIYSIIYTSDLPPTQ